VSVSFVDVVITPLKTDGVYGDPVNVFDYLIKGSISKIMQSIDHGDFDIGLYTYSDLTIKMSNEDGIFNSDKYSSSMFYYTRDRALVDITFVDEQSNSTFLYKGLINDESTKQDFGSRSRPSSVSLRVLSLDSILRKTIVPGGLLKNGQSFSSALKTLLNRPAITTILNYDESKINPKLDLTLDNVESFSGEETKSVLEDVLNASVSVFSIDDTNTMVVSSRDVKPITQKEFFANDRKGRDNLVTFKKFNDGLQRTFNSVKINNTNVNDPLFVERYGARVKKFDWDFITNPNTERTIASAIVEEFKLPKRELELVTKFSFSEEMMILDPVSVLIDKVSLPSDNAERIPNYDSAKYDQDIYPYVRDGLRIDAGIKWKVTAITRDTKSFLTTLRLREV